MNPKGLMIGAGMLALWVPTVVDAQEEAAPETVATIPVEEAQSTAPAPPAAEAHEGPVQLQEIVVTATKREQPLREIPASIDAFSGEQLESSGKLNLNDFIQESPGVVATQGAPGFTRLSFRGISTDTNPTAGNAQPVGIFIGDTPFTDPYIANIVPDLSAFDLSDVVVMKGPQGTLFGGAALSGAIRYQLQEPMLDTWQLRGFGQYANAAHGSTAYTAGVAGNAPIGDTLALRLGYVRRGYPGTVDDLRTGDDDVDQASGDGVRAQLLWQPDAWKIKATWLTQDSHGDNQQLSSDTPRNPRASDKTVLDQPSDNQFDLASLEAGYDFDAMRAVSLTSWVKRDATFAKDYTIALIGTPPPGYPETAAVFSQVIDNSKSLSQEFRLQSTGDTDFNWLVGAYYFDYEMFFNILIDTPLNQSLVGPGSLVGENPLLGLLFAALGTDPSTATSLLNGTSNADSHEYALFADASYKLWDRLTLSAGGRLYKTEVKGGFVGEGLLLAGNTNNGLGSNTVAEIKEDGFNPKVSATYAFSDDVSVYLSAAKGFRFGGLQSIPSTSTNGVPPTYKSDTLWNYEIGLRTDWLDRTLRVDLTTFYIRYKNPIITQATQGIPIGYNTNVSAAISKGFEGSLLWSTPFPGLTWSLAGGYTDAHITEEFTASTGDVVPSGTRMPGSAKWQGNSALQYLLAWDRFSVAPSLSYHYIGKAYSNITHDVDVNGFGTLDAGLVLATEALPGRPTIAINMTNITDVDQPIAGAVGTAIVTQQTDSVYLLSPPRMLTVRIGWEF